MSKLHDFYTSKKSLDLKEIVPQGLFVHRSLFLIVRIDRQYSVKMLGTSDFLIKLQEMGIQAADELILVGGLLPGSYNSYQKKQLKDLRKFLDTTYRAVNYDFSLQNKLYQINLVSDRVVIEQQRPSCLLIDDSGTFLKLASRCLTEFFSSAFVATSNPYNAIEVFSYEGLELVISDINMPDLTGFDLVGLLENTVPILLMSGEIQKDSKKLLNIMSQYLVDFIEKSDVNTELFLEKIRNVKQMRRADLVSNTKNHSGKFKRSDFDFVFIGISTGGVQTLEYVFQNVKRLNIPVVILIHMPKNFTRLLCQRLTEMYGDHFELVDRQMVINRPYFYIVEGGGHFNVTESDGGLSLQLKDAQQVPGFCPNIDYTFKALAKIQSKRILAGVMTGMGKDGAQGLLAVKQSGKGTFVQDEKSSIIYGMPKAAFELGAYDQIMSPSNLVRFLNEFS